MTSTKKLIELALPLEAIHKASAREKSIRHGHPSTLHLWWARRPLFIRAVERPGIRTGDVTLHVLLTHGDQSNDRRRLRRLHGDGQSGHSSTRVLERYTHPREARKLEALQTFRLSAFRAHERSTTEDELAELQDLLRKSGGRQEARTPDLRVANERRERPYLVRRPRRERCGPAE
jgi:putative DNA methylase